MKVKTRIKAGKKGEDSGNRYGKIRKDGTKCRHMETRGLCEDCCIDRHGPEYGNVCQAACGRFYAEG